VRFMVHLFSDGNCANLDPRPVGRLTHINARMGPTRG
jgi:hypothetical protein